MHVGDGRLDKSLARRTCSVIASMTALAAIGFGPAVAPAGASTGKPAKTDVMFVFDTSGSMGSVLEEAKQEIKEVMARISASLPEVDYGVSQVEDYPGYFGGVLEETKTEKEYEESSEKPWKLDQAVTSDPTKITTAIEGLTVGGGGDSPESYGRALWETDTNPNVQWRSGARHLIVLVADQVPHTPNVNEGIPEEFWAQSPFETGEELPGKWGIPGTELKADEKIEFHEVLRKLGSDEKPLEMVDYHDTEGDYIHYWEYWSAATGGQALEAQENGKELSSRLTTDIVEGAEGIPPCPPGFSRAPGLPCVRNPIMPTPIVTPPIKVPSSAPPIPKTIVVLEGGEIEDEFEFPEGGEAEYSGEVDDGAEAARFQPGSLVAQLGQSTAVTARHKSKKCKKGFVKKGKKCVNNAPVQYGRVKLTIPSAGKYKFKLKPSGKALAALKKGKTLNVKVTLLFTPAGTTTHILNTKFVRVHLKPKKKHHGKHKK